MVEGCFFRQGERPHSRQYALSFPETERYGHRLDNPTYNQATFIGSAVMLYKATGEKAYLDDAVLAADYVRNEMCDADGLLPFKNGVEQGIYAAIFAQYIIRLIEDGNQLQYMDWLRHNIDVAWNNRDVNRNVTFKG